MLVFWVYVDVKTKGPIISYKQRLLLERAARKVSRIGIGILSGATLKQSAELYR